MKRPLPHVVPVIIRAPRTAAPAHAAITAPYGDREDVWIRGFCMRCGQTNALVMQTGDVADGGRHMPLFTCRECLRDLRLMLITWTKIRDRVAPPDALHKLNTRLAQRLRRMPPHERPPCWPSGK